MDTRTQDKIRGALERNGDTQEFVIVQTVTMLWVGWECDSTAWLVRLKDDTVRFVLTSHGSAYVGSAKDLQDQIEENEDIVATQREALARLQMG